jgi:hypothetical protein
MLWLGIWYAPASNFRYTRLAGPKPQSDICTKLHLYECVSLQDQSSGISQQCSERQLRLAIDFLADLKSFMDVTIIALNLKSAWAKGSPDLAPLDMLTNETYTVLITKS